jgi:hypothetical protein
VHANQPQMPSKKSKKKASLRQPLQQKLKKPKKSKKRARQEHDTTKHASKKIRESTTTTTTTTPTSTTTTSTDQQQHALANAEAIEVGSKALRDLVKAHADLIYLGTGKVKCTITKHEMKPEEDIVAQHIKSKRYVLEKGYQMNYDHLLPWIRPNTDDYRKLVCTLTGHELNKIPSQLQLHTNSKRFKRLKTEGEEKLRMKEEKQKMKDDKRRARVAAAIARKEAGEEIDVAQTVMEQETSDESSDDSGADSDDGVEEAEAEEDEKEDGVEQEEEEEEEEDVEKVEAKLSKTDGDDFSWIIRGK